MSKKTTTTSTNVYDPASKNTFNAFQPGIQSNIQDWMKDPMKSSYFNTELGQANQQNAWLGQQGQQNIARNFKTSGMEGSPGLMNYMMGANQRSNLSRQSNTFNNLLLNARDQQRQATGMAMGYNPLQTGGVQTQKTSGLGTWLPQVAGMGLGLLTGGMFGGGGGGQSSGASNAYFPGQSSGMNSGTYWNQPQYNPMAPGR
jgi:hypothetical protein